MKKEVELYIDENGEWLEKISLVELPAIESNFLCFSKEDTFKFALEDEQMIVTGPVMIPEKRMLRIDEYGNEYYVYFSAETIKQAAYRWLQENMNHQFNLEHSKNTNKVDVIESWIVNDSRNDKAASLGFSLPKGTWMMSCKVNDEDLWRSIKEGEYNGFSVEGMFRYDDETFNKVLSNEEKIIKEAEEFLATYFSDFKKK